MVVVTRRQHRRQRHAPVLQRFFQRVHRYRKTVHNEVDPFTLETLKPPLFFTITENRVVHAVNALELARYIDATGDYRHPLTRKKFNMVEVRRLQRIANQYLHTKVDLTNIAAREQARQQRLHREELVEFLVADCKHLIALSVDRYTEHRPVREIVMEYLVSLRRLAFVCIDRAERLIDELITLQPYNPANIVFLHRLEQISYDHIGPFLSD